MNKIFYFTFLICCFVVSTKCNETSEETTTETETTTEFETSTEFRRRSIDSIVRENCIELTHDQGYPEKLRRSFDRASSCLVQAFEETYRVARTFDKTDSKLYELICEERDTFYGCLSIGLDAYSACLTEEENVGLTKIRRVFRRIIAQLCEADIVKIIEFLNSDGTQCYKENLTNIGNTVVSMFHTRENPHLPSSYINDKTCGDLTKLHQDLKPVINLCENKSPGIFLQNFVSAIEDELSCESEFNVTHDNEI